MRICEIKLNTNLPDWMTLKAPFFIAFWWENTERSHLAGASIKTLPEASDP